MTDHEDFQIEFYKQNFQAYRENAENSLEMTKFYILLC